MRRWRRALLVFPVFMLAGSASTMSAQAVSSNEYTVKAAFLFHFARFVEWPSEAFGQPDGPLVYCTIGEDPFQGALDASLKDKTLGPHVIQVRHLKQIQDAQNCHLVFVGAEDKKQVATVLAFLKGDPILTVGESERFVQEGGMIGFCVEENKIRFEINLEAAERARLRISSRLLALAKMVIGKPRRN